MPTIPSRLDIPMVSTSKTVKYFEVRTHVHICLQVIKPRTQHINPGRRPWYEVNFYQLTTKYSMTCLLICVLVGSGCSWRCASKYCASSFAAVCFSPNHGDKELPFIHSKSDM